MIIMAIGVYENGGHVIIILGVKENRNIYKKFMTRIVCKLEKED
jgi:hypothetical protein